MSIREFREKLKSIDFGTPVSVRYETRSGQNEVIGRYNGENGYRLFLRFGQNERAPAGSGHLSLKSVSEVSTLQVTPTKVYRK